MILKEVVVGDNMIWQDLVSAKWASSTVLLQPLVQAILVKSVSAVEVPDLLPFLEFRETNSAVYVLCLESCGATNGGVLLFDETEVLGG